MATDHPSPLESTLALGGLPQPQGTNDDPALASNRGGALSPRLAWSPGWRWMVGSAIFYLLCLTVATWPAAPRLGSALPSLVDPVTHIWTMRWNKSCLLEGKLPFHCPDIQYPTGAALGTLPPMHLQTLLYVPLSFVFANDVLCYNIIRIAAFLLMGVGTMLLIWNVLGDRWVATVGGMLAMLSQPIMIFSQTELEQMTVGWFPIFLIAWMRWVDRPTGRGLVASVVLYLLVAMSAPYFGVFVVFPATLYVVWRWVAAWRSGSGCWGWLTARLGWFTGFVALVAPVLVVLFANQIWAIRHGISMDRPDFQFAICRVPFWTYLVPSPVHRLSRALPFSTFVMNEMGLIPAYLGVVTLGLIAYAALGRVKFAGRGYWWAVLLMLVTLSLGAHAWVFGYDISLPGAWLKKYFIGFRMIRVPARFCLFAAVGAALVAAAGLHHLLIRIKAAWARRAVLGLVTVLAVVDLTVMTYPTRTVPPVPPCYAFIRQQDPRAVIADVPHFNDGGFHLPAMSSYWQSFHGGTTTGGYTAFVNTQQNNLLSYTSPFGAYRLADVNFLAHPEDEQFELINHVDFRSYVWLYLTVHQIRYVVFHHAAGAFPELAIHPERTEWLLREALVYNDAETAVFDREKLAPPTRPMILYDRGWGHRTIRRADYTIMVDQSARLWAYNPTADQPMILTLDAAGHKTARRVVLRADGVELTRWTVPPSETELIASPPLKLSAGLHELTLTSDGDAPPSRTDVHIPGDKTPFSLWVTGISFGPAHWEARAGRVEGERVVR